MIIDATGLAYRRLNDQVRAAIRGGARVVELQNVCGQRYIGCGLSEGARIEIHGVPGNDLAMFMNGPQIVVHGNAQDGVGNTMAGGKVVVGGDVGDVLGYAMRGGKVFVRGGAGYRAGIHMKSFGQQQPIVIIGGAVRDYLGEYMAGGILVVLNRGGAGPIGADFVGTGMHGGRMYLAGGVQEWQLGQEVAAGEPSGEELDQLGSLLEEYCGDLALPRMDPAALGLMRLAPVMSRPYGKIYVY